MENDKKIRKSKIYEYEICDKSFSSDKPKDDKEFEVNEENDIKVSDSEILQEKCSGTSGSVIDGESSKYYI